MTWKFWAHEHFVQQDILLLVKSSGFGGNSSWPQEIEK